MSETRVPQCAVHLSDSVQKRLWQYSYPEVYWKDLTPEQAEVNRLHNGKEDCSTLILNNQRLTSWLEHCFDFLRQAAMCHADVGIITYRTPNSWPPLPFTALGGSQTCGLNNVILILMSRVVA